MTYNKAISIMQRGDDTTDAINAITAAVEPLCTTETRNPVKTLLVDWIAAGSYDGSETPESLAAEWDSYADDEVSA